MSASSHTKLFPYEAIFHNSILKGIFTLTTRLGENSLLHTWPQPWGPPVSSLPKRCRAQVCHSNTFTPWKLNGHKTGADTLCDLKLNYHMYFLCKEKVPVGDPSQQATDQFPWDPSATSNYQNQVSVGSQMLRDEADKRNNDLSLLFLVSSRQVQSEGILSHY